MNEIGSPDVTPLVIIGFLQGHIVPRKENMCVLSYTPPQLDFQWVFLFLTLSSLIMQLLALRSGGAPRDGSGLVMSLQASAVPHVPSLASNISPSLAF